MLFEKGRFLKVINFNRGTCTMLTWLKSPKHILLLTEASETHIWEICNFLIRYPISLGFVLVISPHGVVDV